MYSNYNISVMTASDKGLVAPVIKESEKKSIYQISEEMKASGGEGQRRAS